MMRTVLLAAIAASAAAIAGQAAQAQARPPAYITARPELAAKAFGAAVAERIFSGAWTPIRQAAVARSQKSIPGFDCPADPQIALIDVIPYPIKPGTVSWIERYVLGCQPRTMRSLLMILEGEQPRAVELLPGQTGADPLLQRNALQGATAATVTSPRAPKDCRQRYVVDTRTTTPPERSGSWVERWTYDLCGTKVDVDMTFTPSARGGTDWSARLVP